MKKIIALVLALALVLSLPVFAFAEGSPSGDPEYRVQIINVDGGTATGEKNADGSYTVTVTVKDGAFSFFKLPVAKKVQKFGARVLR